MAAESEKVLTLKHVNAGYPGVTVLEEVNFEVARGEIFMLLGGSGSGKSTLVRHLIGLNPVLSGELKVFGREWSAATKTEIFRRIGVAYQSGALFGSLSLLDNVMLPMEELSDWPAAERRERAMALLEEVGLGRQAGLLPAQISGGMKKRAAIARALAMEAELLFLDEPSAGLDPITSAALDALIKRLRDEKGTTFVVVTHELESVYALADRVALFDGTRKRMVALGNPHELKRQCDDGFVRKYFNRER